MKSTRMFLHVKVLIYWRWSDARGERRLNEVDVSRSLFSLMAINCLGRRIWILLNKIMTRLRAEALSPLFCAAVKITSCLIMYGRLTPCSFCNRLLIKIALRCSLSVINVCFWWEKRQCPRHTHSFAAGELSVGSRFIFLSFSSE